MRHFIEPDKLKYLDSLIKKCEVQDVNISFDYDISSKVHEIVKELIKEIFPKKVNKILGVYPTRLIAPVEPHRDMNFVYRWNAMQKALFIITGIGKAKNYPESIRKPFLFANNEWYDLSVGDLIVFNATKQHAVLTDMELRGFTVWFKRF